jgi:hypothetical protein
MFALTLERSATLKALRLAFEEAGIRFTETGVEPPRRD